MKVLMDTSVLVAALVRSHPRHGQSFPWIRKVYQDEIRGLVSTHTLAELYAVLTVLPVSPRITTGQACEMIRENVNARMKAIAVGLSDYRAVLGDISELGLAGGVIYDALTARAARKAGADVLLTLNPDHFLRAWPEGESIIRTP